jgi:hypothetical protein
LLEYAVVEKVYMVISDYTGAPYITRGLRISRERERERERGGEGGRERKKEKTEENGTEEAEGVNSRRRGGGFGAATMAVATSSCRAPA